ncbi:DUF6331 family protein [Gilvimarinus algae]|uniref:DUF6331 family protein n=1 Tax=Gilvimarinus algae TaxID=3058037 RepID=A0ABT8TBS0_9GAMM|nr:DUF6331 family protein [Gilvimarinus sp. SDUM040014]MDO3381530.1 DUF6331 family protein [Gilvimarinus sp. SDUM040014]
MESIKYQVRVSDALAELLDFSEIYCSAACCGLQAFEIHRGLLIRKIIDKNLEGTSGIDWYNELKAEVDSLHHYISNLAVKDETEISVFYPQNTNLPEFHLPKNELQHFFLRWQRVFTQTKGTQAVP